MAIPANQASLGELAERYSCILFDSFGVFVDGSGARCGAKEAIDELRRRSHPFFIVTNDATRSAESTAERYRTLGLEIDPLRVLSSGSLIPDYFSRHGLAGAKTVVLGPEESIEFARIGGAEIVEADAAGTIEALVVADSRGYRFLETVEETISMLVHAFERGESPRLILPNPDLSYPKDRLRFGLTAGSVALLIESALARSLPRLAPKFSQLGKPHRPIFDKARELAGTDRLIMIGDQLETDIAGAKAAGIDSALLLDGVSRDPFADSELRPTYILSDLTW